MWCQLVLIKWTQAILEVPLAFLKSVCHSHGIETDFDMNSCEPGLALMKRLRTTQKWVFFFLQICTWCIFWNCSLACTYIYNISILICDSHLVTSKYVRKTLRRGFSLVGIAVMWIPVFQCNTIVILSESKLNCLCYQKELWICIV